jgi:uncharacterized protein YecE (DUF72 family)
MEDQTADFVYIRLHGDVEMYASGYGDAALAHWVRRIGVWSRGGQVNDAQRVSPRDPPRRSGRDVFCYFDNDVKVHAPYDAARLAARLGLPSGSGVEPCSAPSQDLPGTRARAPAMAGRQRRG